MIYKYRSFNSSYKYDIFKHSEAYFARPSEFNDPFESKPRLVGLDTDKKRKIFVDKYVKSELSDKNHKEQEKYKNQFLIRLSDKKLITNDIHRLLDLHGIFSTAKKWSQCLMWSHYSDSHKGFCVGFEFDGEFDNDMGMSYEVRYAKHYPEVDLELFAIYDESNDAGLLETALATKSSEWSYEEEIRYIKLAHNGGSGKYKFNKHKVKEVIVGACISQENKNEIIAVVKSYMPWVNIYQSVLSQSKYELTKKKLS